MELLYYLLAGAGAAVLLKKDEPIVVAPAIEPVVPVVLPKPVGVVVPIIPPIVLPPIRPPVIVVPPPQPIIQQTGQGILINENFEVNDMNGLVAKGWIFTDEANAKNMDIVSSPVHGGTRALRFKYHSPGCVPSGSTIVCPFDNCKIGRPYTPVEELFVRYYVRYEKISGSRPSAFVDISNASAKQHYINPGGADPVSIIVGYFYHDTAASSIGMGVQNPSGGVTTKTYAPNRASHIMPFGRWVRVEYQITMNTPGIANGILRVWMDGVLTMEYTNVMLRAASQPGSRLRTIQLYRQGAVWMDRFEDDFKMATYRIGQ